MLPASSEILRCIILVELLLLLFFTITIYHTLAYISVIIRLNHALTSYLFLYIPQFGLFIDSVFDKESRNTFLNTLVSTLVIKIIIYALFGDYIHITWLCFFSYFFYIMTHTHIPVLLSHTVSTSLHRQDVNKITYIIIFFVH